MEIDEFNKSFRDIFPLRLSVLIATMPNRRESYKRLLESMGYMIKSYPNVEIITDDSMDYNIGVKRNKLLQKAKGDYIVFCDDDDLVSFNYIDYIFRAIKDNPDCIAINGIITTNGQNERKWFISKEYGKWYTGPDGTYYRTPNHISPVKRELALQAGFPEISFGEDAEYSRRLLPLLKTESIITEPIYHYDYWEK